MKKRVSIKDVADHAGVSVATVSLVLNDKGRISEATQRQVHKSVAALGFIPNKSASRLRSGRSLLIGLIVNDISNPFFAELSADVEKEASAKGFLPVMANTGEDLSRQQKVIETMIGQGVAGFIISAVTGSDAQSFALIRERGIPYVLCVRDVQDFDADFVGFDNLQGGQIAGQHLVDLGHREIGFIGGEAANINRMRRLEGVRSAMASAGADLPSERDISGAATQTFGVAAAGRLLDADRPPTAIVCFNDSVAVGAFAAVAERGLKVGVDVSIVGFDNVPEAAAWSPPLTTVELFPRAVGGRSARALLDRIADPSVAAERVYLSPKLILRKSTGSVADS
ncbi:LacI family DNA-binding transcriptional regulator [Oceanomicrobium pacificus]|uniref:Substrate-binding domain-containing protein n=1 Tax=Oceanomicrobium pacificus TaxID=2692916 RepID=A0A6B0TT13_9RHOB|nr:LacI family DNA-binding transcriptional regulator [Oceanomicrobium pacificus]MXU64362.1 substrate-binding domain-containing protein [Oceanomicrobium pacificus]